MDEPKCSAPKPAALVTESMKGTVDIPSSPTTLVNTPTDHPSPADAKDDEEQQLRTENAQLKSSIVELAKILSREKKVNSAAEERATAAEERSAAAERRAEVVAERAINMGTQMERASQDCGTQVNRAANAEAETMRLRLEMLEMQKEILSSNHKAVLEQDRPSDDLDQAKEVAAGVFQDVTEDAAAASSTTMVEERLLRAEMMAHQQTQNELDLLKEDMRFRDGQLERHQAFLRDITGELREVQNGLQTQLDDANLRISELEVANHRLRFRIPPLQRQVQDLTNQARRMFDMLAHRDDVIRNGIKELKILIKLGTKLHARVKKAEKMLNCTLGRDDHLMRMAEWRFPIHVPGDPYFGDIIDEDVNSNSSEELKARLAIEGLPAEFFEERSIKLVSEHEEVSGDDDTERLVSDIFEVQHNVDNSNVVDFEAEGPASNNSDLLGTEDVVFPGVTAAKSEDTQKDSGFKFAFEIPAQETRQKTEDNTKKPVFAFGGTPAKESRQKADGTAKKPVFLFSATPAQDTPQEISLEMTASSQGFNLSQQVTVPDVSGVPAADGNSEEPKERIHVEDRDKNDHKGTSAVMFGNHEVSRDQLSVNQPDTLKGNGDAQEFIFGATAPLVGAQPNPNPVSSGNADSSSFNFASATDFNFGTTTTFEARSNPFTAQSKAVGVADEDGQNEALSKKTGSVSKHEAVTFTAFSSPSSGAKEKKTEKKNKVAPIFKAAASINLSSPSSASVEGATKKQGTASIFEAAAPISFSSLGSNDKVTPGASFNHDPKVPSENPHFTSMGGFNFSATAAKGKEKKQELTPNETPFKSAAGTSNRFSFSSNGVAPSLGGFSNGTASASKASLDLKHVDVRGKDKQKQTSTKKAAKAPLFPPEAFAKFDSPASGERAKFDRFNFGIAGSSDIQSKAKSPVSDLEQKQRSGAKVGHEDLEVLTMSSTPLPTSEGRAEEAVDVLEKHGFDIAALVRIVASVTLAVQQSVTGEEGA